MWKTVDRVQVSTAIIGHEDGWNMPFHRHESFECSAVLEGDGFFQAEGEAPVPIEAGHVVLIPPDVLHSYRTESSIRFGVLQAGKAEPETVKLFRSVAETDKAAYRLLYLSPHELGEYETLFRSWLRAISRPLRERERVANTWIRLLLLTLMQSADSRVKRLSIAGSADYIRDNVARSVPIRELAAMAGVSESSFRRQFHETYGVSPKQYVQNCRLAEAKWLLRASDKPIRFVAEQVGFASIHAFSAWFQKTAGTAPAEWRKRQRGGMDL
ncbi:AraC family transcriptional regulator [Paenibacillus sp. GYB003]|uniref:AraC family transcriptional regulator n=1 Tax=Paenibacillus sp. GYB003 TaxID=2994392 RepID=UPI002F96D5DA